LFAKAAPFSGVRGVLKFGDRDAVSEARVRSLAWVVTATAHSAVRRGEIREI
jgi:hypothetical protein